MEKILTRGKSFIDSTGRERIFKGFNIVNKNGDRNSDNNPKEKFDFEFDDEFFDEFVEKGFNVLRLGFSWASVEPQPGQYNEQYLDSIEAVLDKSAEKGVYVFLDFHQDCYSAYCYDNGAPAWATITDKYKPRPAKLVWAEGYFRDKAVHRAFDNFWTNREYKGKGLQDYYADAWKHMAKRFKDKPALFGFDFMNEPYPGSGGGKVFKKIIGKLVRVTLVDRDISRRKLIAAALKKGQRIRVLDQYDAKIFRKITSAGDELIKKFDTEWYMPFLNKMTAAVREVTDEGIVFVDNSYWSNISIPCSNSPITVNGKRDAKQCFSPHGYDLLVDTPAYKYASNARVGAIFDGHKKTQDRLDMPVLVGEWGGNAVGIEWLPHVQFLLETFDRYKWSNTYWHYHKGLLKEPVAETIIRPTPKAVTGNIIAYHYDSEQAVFELEYEQTKEFDVPTVVYVHKPVKSIFVDGEYTVEKIGDSDAADIYIKTGIGHHKVRIEL